MPKPYCKTGIDILDSDMNGGLPSGNIILLSGASGVGKTTFCMQFLFNGLKYNEKGVFFTSSENVTKLKKFQAAYNFFDETKIKSGDIIIADIWSISDRLGLSPESYDVEEATILFEVIRDIVKEVGAKRLIIDSITSLCYRLSNRDMIRDFIFKLGSSLTILDCTTFLTSEIPPKVFQFSVNDIEEFISDGIIFMSDIERQGDLIRTLQIIKMRGTSHSRSKYVLNLSSKNGVDLTPMFQVKS
ncbi:MAG: RAD55 family ATPase [Atribacterota bacterium]